MANESNEQLWASRVAAWRSSGVSSVAFCEGRDFTPGGLRHAAYRLGRRSKVKAKSTSTSVALERRPAVQVVRVERTAPTLPSSVGQLTVEFAGVRVQIPLGVDVQTLRSVFEAAASIGGTR